MTDQPEEQEGGPPRRKFDDVASLFGTIVPTPGAVPRAAPRYTPPPAPPPPPPPPPPPAPREPPPPVEPTAVARTVRPETLPKPVRRPEPAPKRHPTEVRWPDAFEPRPNYRRREPRNWAWLLLIPVGFVAAVGITMLDPRAIRGWIEVHVLHRTALPATTAPLLTTPPTAALPLAEVPSPYTALPTSPVPVPPGTEVSPPPISPAEAAAAAAVPLHITIQYRRNVPGSDGEARRIAALLQSFGGSIELHPIAATVRVPTITYYNDRDKAAATALAAALANEAIDWTIRAGTAKAPAGTLDVWLP